MTRSFTTFFYFSIIIMMINCSSLLNHLRKHKTISFQSSLSSPIEINLNQGSNFVLTCSFFSNFDQIDIFWLHNGTLIQSFISKTIEEDENSFLAVTIITKINIEKTDFDMNGFYQCIAVHQDIHAQQTFNINVNYNGTNRMRTNFSRDALITVHTSQTLFEPRTSLSLMCRVSNNRCKIEWFNPDNELLNIFGEKRDLVIKNGTFDDHMGLYTCQICCVDQCQKLTSFIYPAEEEK